jgi:hypothetical protein
MECSKCKKPMRLVSHADQTETTARHNIYECDNGHPLERETCMWYCPYIPDMVVSDEPITFQTKFNYEAFND